MVIADTTFDIHQKVWSDDVLSTIKRFFDLNTWIISSQFKIIIIFLNFLGFSPNLLKAHSLRNNRKKVLQERKVC